LKKRGQAIIFHSYKNPGEKGAITLEAEERGQGLEWKLQKVGRKNVDRWGQGVSGRTEKKGKPKR